MVKRLFLFLFLGFALPINLTGCTMQTLENAERFFNFEYKFSMLFPKTWETKTDYMGTAMASLSPVEGADDNFRENVNVAVKDVPKQTEVDHQYQEMVTQISRGIPDFIVKENGVTSLANARSRWLVYSLTAGNWHIETLLYMFIKDNKLFLITCTSTTEKFAQYRDTFTKISKSFRFEKYQ